MMLNMSQYQRGGYVGAGEKDARDFSDVKNNDDTLVNPQTTDDSSKGYGRRSIWINRQNDTAYICVDSTRNHAIWIPVGGGNSSASSTGQSLGTGAAIYKETTSDTLKFKSLIAGDRINITTSGDEVTIAVAANQSVGDDFQDQIDAINALLSQQSQSTTTTSNASWAQIASFSVTTA
ncbi:MAG: hypothetical protein ACMG6E_09300, partial [Candidatus Roizmanbacteria bacterium]